MNGGVDTAGLPDLDAANAASDALHFGGVADDEMAALAHRNAPQADSACLYGLIGEVARAAR